MTGAAVTTKAYDGNTDAVITGATLSGVVGTEDVTLANASAGTFDTKDIGTGKSVATAPMTLDGSGHRELHADAADADRHITAKGLTVTGITANDKTYDGNTTATLNTAGAVLVGKVPGDDVTLGHRRCDGCVY